VTPWAFIVAFAAPTSASAGAPRRFRRRTASLHRAFRHGLFTCLMQHRTNLTPVAVAVTIAAAVLLLIAFAGALASSGPLGG